MPHFSSRPVLLALALIVVLCLTAGGATFASAQARASIRPQANDGFDPGNPCETASMPQAIEITSSASGEWLNLPATRIAVDPCTLMFLRNGGSIAQVKVISDGSVPEAIVHLLELALATHANDFWRKDLTCPRPARGVAFTVIAPDNFWLLGFTPTPTIDAIKLLFPAIRCR